jgi:putative acyl-CoA dehydrogenase
LPDGQRNGVHLERLKDKLGNRANASSEVEFFKPAAGWWEEGDGVRQILKMGGLTRFDCALGSHALMRRAYSVALYHALQRQAFGKNLVDQPIMRQVLGQMALRLEGQTAFLFRLARAWDRRDDARKRYGQGCSRPRRICHLQIRDRVCRRGDGGAGRLRLL